MAPAIEPYFHNIALIEFAATAALSFYWAHNCLNDSGNCAIEIAKVQFHQLSFS
jgi:hypothetical protein